MSSVSTECEKGFWLGPLAYFRYNQLLNMGGKYSNRFVMSTLLILPFDSDVLLPMCAIDFVNMILFADLPVFVIAFVFYGRVLITTAELLWF